MSLLSRIFSFGKAGGKVAGTAKVGSKTLKNLTRKRAIAAKKAKKAKGDFDSKSKGGILGKLGLVGGLAGGAGALGSLLGGLGGDAGADGVTEDTTAAIKAVEDRKKIEELEKRVKTLEAQIGGFDTSRSLDVLEEKRESKYESIGDTIGLPSSSKKSEDNKKRKALLGDLITGAVALAVLNRDTISEMFTFFGDEEGEGDGSEESTEVVDNIPLDRLAAAGLRSIDFLKQGFTGLGELANKKAAKEAAEEAMQISSRVAAGEAAEAAAKEAAERAAREAATKRFLGINEWLAEPTGSLGSRVRAIQARKIGAEVAERVAKEAALGALDPRNAPGAFNAGSGVTKAFARIAAGIDASPKPFVVSDAPVMRGPPLAAGAPTVGPFYDGRPLGFPSRLSGVGARLGDNLKALRAAVKPAAPLSSLKKAISEIQIKKIRSAVAENTRKLVAKGLPLVGEVAGGYFVGEKLFKGDLIGATMELGSLFAPSAAGIPLDAVILQRDIYNAVFDNKHDSDAIKTPELWKERNKFILEEIWKALSEKNRTAKSKLAKQYRLTVDGSANVGGIMHTPDDIGPDAALYKESRENIARFLDSYKKAPTISVNPYRPLTDAGISQDVKDKPQVIVVPAPAAPTPPAASTGSRGRRERRAEQSLNSTHPTTYSE